jgi:hypothetical protein
MTRPRTRALVTGLAAVSAAGIAQVAMAAPAVAAGSTDTISGAAKQILAANAAAVGGGGASPDGWCNGWFNGWTEGSWGNGWIEGGGPDCDGWTESSGVGAGDEQLVGAVRARSSVSLREIYDNL